MKTKMKKTSVLMVVSVVIFLAFGASPAVYAGEIDDVILDDFIDIPDDELEVITVEPAWDYVWIPGSWERDPGKWTWTKGRWEKPPHKKARWVDGHWKYQESKWYWNRGYWLVASDGYIVDEFIDIPVDISETRPIRPSKKHHWVAGYWEWDGVWFWSPGYWSLKPHPKAEWVEGHWDPYGTFGWRWMAGHWNVRG